MMADVATMTITEFLLARIAEDETGAMSGAYGHAFPARVLAECEAKREVVDGVKDWSMGNAILRRLAAVYADHPDYRDEWRP